MRRLVQFLCVIRKDIALFRRQFSRPERQANQPLTHPHKVFDFGPHYLRQSIGPGLLTVLGTFLVFPHYAHRESPSNPELCAMPW